MKRVLMGVVAAAGLVFGGLFTSTAEAGHPHGGHHHGQRQWAGYGAGFGGGHCGPSIGYGFYGGCRPAPPPCFGGYVPYGAGYLGGYQPYQGHLVRPRVGLYFNF